MDGRVKPGHDAFGSGADMTRTKARRGHDKEKGPDSVRASHASVRADHPSRLTSIFLRGASGVFGSVSVSTPFDIFAWILSASMPGGKVKLR